MQPGQERGGLGLGVLGGSWRRLHLTKTQGMGGSGLLPPAEAAAGRGGPDAVPGWRGSWHRRHPGKGPDGRECPGVGWADGPLAVVGWWTLPSPWCGTVVASAQATPRTEGNGSPPPGGRTAGGLAVGEGRGAQLSVQVWFGVNINLPRTWMQKLSTKS